MVQVDYARQVPEQNPILAHCIAFVFAVVFAFRLGSEGRRLGEESVSWHPPGTGKSFVSFMRACGGTCHVISEGKIYDGRRVTLYVAVGGRIFYFWKYSILGAL